MKLNLFACPNHIPINYRYNNIQKIINKEKSILRLVFINIVYSRDDLWRWDMLDSDYKMINKEPEDIEDIEDIGYETDNDSPIRL